MSLVDCLPCSVRRIQLGRTRPLREEWVAPCSQRASPAPSAVINRSRRASQKVVAPDGLQALQALQAARAARPARLSSNSKRPTRIWYAYRDDPVDIFRRPCPFDCLIWARRRTKKSQPEKEPPPASARSVERTSVQFRGDDDAATSRTNLVRVRPEQDHRRTS